MAPSEQEQTGCITAVRKDLVEFYSAYRRSQATGGDHEQSVAKTIMSGDFNWYGKEATNHSTAVTKVPDWAPQSEGDPTFKQNMPQGQREYDIQKALPRHLQPVGGRGILPLPARTCWSVATTACIDSV